MHVDALFDRKDVFVMKSKLVFLLIFLITIAFSGPAFPATYTYDNANRLLSLVGWAPLTSPLKLKPLESRVSGCI
jgi:hypothetical protein